MYRERDWKCRDTWALVFYWRGRRIPDVSVSLEGPQTGAPSGVYTKIYYCEEAPRHGETLRRHRAASQGQADRSLETFFL